MPLSLDRTLLATPPLIVTLAQVRFEQHAGIVEPATASALRAPMAKLDMPVAAQLHQQQIILGGGAPSDAAPQQVAAGWQFRSRDGSTVVTVMADQVTVETRRYDGWKAFHDVLRRVLAAVDETASPQLATRLGLRYVNRVRPREAITAVGWQEQHLVDPTFLGPAVGSRLSEYISATEGRATISFPDGVDALVHYGVTTEDEGQVFMLDIDCFRQEAEAFDLETVLAGMTSLNDRSLEVFQSVIKDELRAEMLAERQ